MVAEVDDSLKTLRLTLEANAKDRTLLVVASDNGGAGARLVQPRFAGQKAQYYEGGVRVPLVVSGGYVNKQARGRRLQSRALPDLRRDVLASRPISAAGGGQGVGWCGPRAPLIWDCAAAAGAIRTELRAPVGVN